MAHDRSFPDCCRVRRLFCPATVLSLSVIQRCAGPARVGLICTLTPVLFQPSHSHSRMIKYSAGWELGAVEPAGCSLEDFNFVFLSLPFSSLAPTMFVHSCVHQCDYNRGEGARLRGHMSQIGSQILGFQWHQLKHKMY